MFGNSINSLDIIFGIARIWIILFKELWFIWAIAGAFIALGFLAEWWKRRKERKELQQWLKEKHILEEWHKIDPYFFEKLTAFIFERLGYRVKRTGGPGDKGIDLVASKNKHHFYIQCKRVEKVQPKQLRAFYGAITDRLRKGDKGIFVTTGLYTSEDKQFAQEKNIQLIDGLELQRIVDSVRRTGKIK